MKSVLLHIGRDSGQESRLQVALDVTRAFEGHLTCLQVTPMDAFATIEPYGVSYLLTQTIEQIRDQQQAERDRMQQDLANEGVNWEWHTHAGAPASMVANHSWLADLVVMSAPHGEWAPEADNVPSAADVVMLTRAPLLVVPESCTGMDCTAPVVIAWNGSPEACAALRAARPLLAMSSAVKLVTVGKDDGFDLPSTDAATYLARHGIAAEMVELPKGAAPVTETLLAYAEGIGASCVVMGAYGHSRLRENIFGGVTRGMLLKADLPLLLAH